ncbi:MAG TPA: hypothetical protein HPP83_03680 [Candidatus Hydrogenedentes bacterium]|nr:hypothetical protein [Candidatus Hydrogenedentota bacterium]
MYRFVIIPIVLLLSCTSFAGCGPGKKEIEVSTTDQQREIAKKLAPMLSKGRTPEAARQANKK